MPELTEQRCDVLLTHGYYLSEDPLELQTMKPYPPLGILYLSSWLKQQGHSVEVFDTTFASPEDFHNVVDRVQPQVVGIYCNMMTRRNAVPMIDWLRRRRISVVVGGPDPAGYIDQYLDHGADVVVIGEGEDTMSELLTAANNGWDDTNLAKIDGIAFRNSNGTTVQTKARQQLKDLDALPFPDRTAIDLTRYMDTWQAHHGIRPVSLITARGCPYTCTWCSHAVYGYSHRRRTPENVADEIEWIRDRYDPDMLWYADDVFTIHGGWLQEFSSELDRRNLHLPFETISREDRLDDKTIELLAHMKCKRLWIGAESGSQDILDAMKRRTSADRVVELVHALQEHGIEAGLFIMLGYHGEQTSDLRETVDFLKAAAPDIYLTTIAYPIRNTPYFESVKDNVILTRPWADASDRDHLIIGRHSDRYYRHVNRWLRAEVDLHIERQKLRPDYIRLASTFGRSLAGRIGMTVWRNETVAAPG